MWEGLSGGSRAGLTLERWSQLAVFTIQLIDLDAVVVCLVEDGAHQVRLFRVPTCRPSGNGDTREEGGTVTESLVYQVSTHQIRRKWRAARSSMSQGSAEPLCARIKGVNRNVSEGKTGL